MEADFVCVETWASSHPPSYPRLRSCKAVAVTHTQSGSKGCSPSLLGGWLVSSRRGQGKLLLGVQV